MKFWKNDLITDYNPTRRVGDAGIDFYLPHDVNFKAKRWQTIDLGIHAKFDILYALIAYNKSGISQLGLVVGACVVDSSYTGSIHLHLYNTNDHDVFIEKGKKIVQFIPQRIDHNQFEMDYSYTLEDFYGPFINTSPRGNKGFGSTQV